MQCTKDHDAWVRAEQDRRREMESSVGKTPVLSKEERDTKLNSFLSRLEQDMADRHTRIRKAEREINRAARSSSQASKRSGNGGRKNVRSTGSLPPRKSKKTSTAASTA